MKKAIINSVYQTYFDKLSDSSSVNINYLELGRRILTDNYETHVTMQDAGTHNRNVINSILEAAEVKLGRPYISSLKKTLVNRLSELNSSR